MTGRPERLCACHRTTTPHTTCDLCLEDLAAVLDSLEELEEQLTVARSRQHGASIAGGTSSAETPLPWDEGASLAERRLHEKLTSWVRRCETHHVADVSPYPDGPRSTTITGLAEWLSWRIYGLAHHGFTTSMLRDLKAAATAAERAATWQRTPKVFLGRCTEPDCDGEIYAKEAAAGGRCVACRKAYITEDQRRAMERELDDGLYTAAQIAHMTTHLGLDLDRERVRKRINQWHGRRRITARQHTDAGDPLFRYGEVRDLLYAEMVKRPPRTW